MHLNFKKFDENSFQCEEPMKLLLKQAKQDENVWIAKIAEMLESFLRHRTLTDSIGQESLYKKNIEKIKEIGEIIIFKSKISQFLFGDSSILSFQNGVKMTQARKMVINS